MDEPLRYADCPGTSAELAIAAPPATVWRLVCDIDLPARFSNEFQGAHWLDGADAPRLGARFRGRNEHSAIGAWETTSTVVELEPERVFSWAVSDPQTPAARWWFTLTPRDGGTRLAMRMHLGPARSGVNRAIDAMPDKEDRILRRRLAELLANMEATLRGIKELAESQAPSALSSS